MKKTALLAFSVFLCSSNAVYGSVVVSVLTSPSQIAAFETGKTVETFDNISGVPGFNITNFNSNQATSGTGLALFQFRNGGAGFIPTSGGAAPAGVFNISGTTATTESGTKVLAPLDGNQNTCFSSTAGCFMAFELLFEQGVQSVGFFMNLPAAFINVSNDMSVDVDTSAGTINRVNETPISSNSNVGAGFVTITSTAADINGISIGMTGSPMFIDDVTFSRSASATTTPEPASFTLAGAALAMLMLKRKRRPN